MFSSEKEPWNDKQPGKLDVGIFVTASSSNSDRTHWIRVWSVSRHGDLGAPTDWSWDTCAIPLQMLKEVLSVLENSIVMELEDRYGIQDELPK